MSVYYESRLALVHPTLEFVFTASGPVVSQIFTGTNRVVRCVTLVVASRAALRHPPPSLPLPASDPTPAPT